jgi:hypothetical protein
MDKIVDRRSDLGSKVMYSVLTLIICGFLSASFFTGILKAEKAQEKADSVDKKVDVLSQKLEGFVDKLGVYCSKQDNTNDKILEKLGTISESVIRLEAKEGI